MTDMAARLQSDLIDTRHQRMIERLTKATMTDLISKTDSTTQVDIASDALTSSTDSEASPKGFSTLKESPPLSSTSINPTAADVMNLKPHTHLGRGHKRTRSDGEIAVQKRRMQDAMVKVKDLSTSIRSGLPLSEALRKHKARDSSKCQDRNKHHQEHAGGRREEKWGVRMCSEFNCVWRQQMKSSQQRLRTLAKQVRRPLLYIYICPLLKHHHLAVIVD